MLNPTGYKIYCATVRRNAFYNLYLRKINESNNRKHLFIHTVLINKQNKNVVLLEVFQLAINHVGFYCAGHSQYYESLQW